jgi:hypothetical protein
MLKHILYDDQGLNFIFFLFNWFYFI